ncbi:MAG TPA: hypothetical protein VLA35_05800, partial [Thermoleophilia bacterium]|nr:hypothetical protein [Thermoleophilia bacterium]
ARRDAFRQIGASIPRAIRTMPGATEPPGILETSWSRALALAVSGGGPDGSLSLRVSGLSLRVTARP